MASPREWFRKHFYDPYILEAIIIYLSLGLGMKLGYVCVGGGAGASDDLPLTLFSPNPSYICIFCNNGCVHVCHTKSAD